MAAAACACGLKADMVAYWKLDDANGTRAVDSVGGHDGQLVGNPVRVGGRFGGALQFDGIDDYVNCGGGKRQGDPNTWGDIKGPITVAAWIKVNAFTKDWQAIVTKGDSAWRIARGAASNGVNFDATSVSGTIWGVAGNVEVNDDRWHHVAGVYDGSTALVYVDGKPGGSLADAGRIRSNDFDVCIGTNLEMNERLWNGLIDEVAVFDHALSREEIVQLRDLSGESFVSEGLRMLGRTVEEAVKAKSAGEAAALIEKRLAEAGNPEGRGEPERIMLSRLYFMLARARQGSKAPVKEIRSAYRESALLSAKAPDYVPALLWLLRNGPADDYSAVIKQSIRNTTGISTTIGHAIVDFEAAGDWSAFRLFLDGMFSEADDQAACAAAVASSLKENGAWADSFARYCRDKPELSEYVVGESEKLAEQAARRNDFARAAEIYRDILARCGDERRMGYGLKVCDYLFQSGKATAALAEISRFTEEYGTVDRPTVIQANLLKGRTYLQLNETGRASDVFLNLLIVYPETTNTAEACFFMGYCSMLLGNTDEAKEAFEIVTRDYPDSMHASKARLCLRRMENTAG